MRIEPFHFRQKRGLRRRVIAVKIYCNRAIGQWQMPHLVFGMFTTSASFIFQGKHV